MPVWGVVSPDWLFTTPTKETLSKSNAVLYKDPVSIIQRLLFFDVKLFSVFGGDKKVAHSTLDVECFVNELQFLPDFDVEPSKN